jgi:lipopolysaccharide transport system ATP-binding protein
MSDVVIRVENLSKEYRLGTISHGTLYQDLQSGWAKFWGKEDPNAMIGSINREQLNSTNDRFLALNNVSFDVHQGEVVGIIGRNGAGKSTLLKLISRVTAPTSGTIKIKGRVASLLEVGTGFHPELTGRENIFLNGAILGMRKGEIEQKFDEIVRFAEIDKFIDTPVKRYSSGMYVRLAFAVAAHLEPEILLVDEVLAVGDAAFQKKCIGKMGDVAKEGRTVLFVSHNMAAVQQLCSRALLLKTGNVVKDGNVSDVIGSYLKSPQKSGDSIEPGIFDLSQRDNRYNSGKPIIKKVVLLGDDNIPRSTFLTGERMRIAFLVEGLSEHPRSELGTAFKSEYDQWVTSASTWMCNTIIEKPRNKSEWAILEIKNLCLTPGKWGLYISSTIHSAGVYLDKIDDGVYFTVEGADYYGSGQLISKEYGLFCLDFEWRITQDLNLDDSINDCNGDKNL